MSFLPGLFPAGAVARAPAIGGGPFPAGDQTAPDLYTLVQQMAASSDNMAVPAAGGTLTVNGESLGSYDYVIKDGSQTVSSFLASSWFTTTQDSRSAFVVVKGNLTISSGQIVIPSVRKLFTTIYVTGDLTVDGGISMTARGANHSSSGSNISAAAIRIATGTYSGVTNPQVPAAGAAGSPGTGFQLPGVAGSDGTDGQTGGGGSGGTASSPSAAGSGAAGTSFSGGSGSGGARDAVSSDAESNGGAGSNGAGNGGGGGAGNPGGAGSAGGGPGGDGTGGVLIVICDGTLSGSGTISANGVAGGNSESNSFRPGGGGSGGGSVTVLYGTDSGPTPTATGGAGGQGTNGRSGGAGGDGTARKLAL